MKVAISEELIIKRIKTLITLIVIFFVVFILKTNSANAATPTLTDVFNGAPSGMSLGNYFEYPTNYDGTTAVANSVQILKSDTTGYPSDIIRLTNGNNEVSSVWGRVSDPGKTNDTSYDYNYLDLTKRQVISGWMYLGDTYNVSGDGLALVLQNDTRGIKAISTYSSSPIIGSKKSKAYGGESLGVWGTSGGGQASASGTKDFASTAIQNSLAVEFDSFRNETAASFTNPNDNFFDGLLNSNNVLEAKGEHIAWNYPGDSATYAQENSSFVYTYYGMHHKDAIHNLTLTGYDGTPSVNEAWHHFSFIYDPPTTSGGTNATISYIFNDKDYDGTVRPYKDWDQRLNIPIDTSKFNLSSGQTKIRWGFTGSTGTPGSTPGDNSIILETIPAVADVTATTSLYDLTQNRNIIDLDKNSEAKEDATVNDNDKLRFDYTLKYNSGLVATGALTTKINLPEHVDFSNNSDGNIGKITYTNSTGTVTTIDIPKSSLNSTGTSLSLNLKSLDATNNNLKVQLYGTAQAPNSDVASSTTIAQEHTSYKSTNYEGDVMSPEFIINNEQLNITNENELTQNVVYNSDIPIQGIVNYVKGSNFDGTDLTIHTNIDGVEQSNATLSTTKNTATTKFSLVYNGLSLGKHTIAVYLTDAGHRVSNTLTYNITVTDYKNLKLSATDLNVNSLVNNDITLKGNLDYDDGSEFSSSDMTLYWSIDNGVEKEQKLSDTGTVTTSDFSHVIAGSELASGKHTITVYAKDGSRTSNVLTYNVTVLDKYAKLDVDDYKFNNINYGAALDGVYVKRSGKWDVNVTSYETPWILYAKGSKFVSDDKDSAKLMDATMVFIDSKDLVSSMDNDVEIARDSTVPDTEKVTDVSKSWNSDDGILLNVNSYNNAGTYKGTINWQLVESLDS